MIVAEVVVVGVVVVVVGIVVGIVVVVKKKATLVIHSTLEPKMPQHLHL